MTRAIALFDEPRCFICIDVSRTILHRPKDTYMCVCVYIYTDLYVYTSVYIQILSNNASAISQEDRPLLQKQNERIFHSYLWIFTHSRKIWRWKSTCNMQKYLKYSKYNTRSNFSIIFKRSLLEFYFIFFFAFFF